MELIKGQIYYDPVSRKYVEFGYMQDDLAIVYNAGRNNTSAPKMGWSVDPNQLIIRDDDLVICGDDKESGIFKENQCCCGGDQFHKFEPRYDDGIDKELLGKFLTPEGVAILNQGDKTLTVKEKIGGKIYVCDICVQCGMKIDRNENTKILPPPPPIPPPNRRIKENK